MEIKAYELKDIENINNIMNLDKGAEINIDKLKVPEELRKLIPIVEKWAFKDQQIREQFIKQMIKERKDEVAVFNSAVSEKRNFFQVWSKSLDSFDKHLSEFTKQDWEHPYWSFLIIFKIEEEIGAPNSIVLEAKKRVAKEYRKKNFKEACSIADAAFRAGNYAQYLMTLQPYFNLLSTVQKKKYNIAEKRK